jgi:hypothetical protein
LLSGRGLVWGGGCYRISFKLNRLLWPPHAAV